MMAKIVRTPTRAEGGLTADEELAMAAHTAIWIKRAMRTDPIEPEKIIPAIEGLYAAAGLKKPRVVIVPSPLVMAFAYGAAAAIWHRRSATLSATLSATDIATDGATDIATLSATHIFDNGAAQACFDMAGKFGLDCAARWANNYQGGNMWAAWDCYLTAARDILGLRLLPHAAYAHWENAAIHGGFRVMHPEFCMVCDFPEFIKTDNQNEPHCETGPSHRWRDGWSLYHWHGVAVPAEWIEKPTALTPQTALGQQDTALRIAAMQIIGWPRMIEQLSAKVVNRHPEGLLGGELLAVSKSLFNPDERGTMKFLRAECPRNGIICFRVPDETKTAHEAQAWKAGLPPNIYQLPSTRT